MGKYTLYSIQKTMGYGVMWTENIIASVQEVIWTNPYLSYIAYPLIE